MGFYEQMKKKLIPRTVDKAAIEGAEDLGLQELSVWGGLSVKTLRAYLTDPERPLPHHRFGARIVVNKDAYRKWRSQFRVDENNEITALVENAVGGKKALEDARARLARAKKGVRRS